jgi:hypothetical protein
MVRLSLTTAFVSSLLAATALAGPIERENFVKVPLKKVARGTPSATSVVRHDQARLAAANLKSSKGGSSSSGTVENDVFSYIAPVQVGSQTFDVSCGGQCSEVDELIHFGSSLLILARATLGLGRTPSSRPARRARGERVHDESLLFVLTPCQHRRLHLGLIRQRSVQRHGVHRHG